MTAFGLTSLLAAAVILTACQRDIDVAVTAAGDAVEFSVADDKPPCIDRVTVYAADDRANPIWTIDTAERSRCVARFRYGMVPSGFEQRGGVGKLVPGKLYLVAVGRTGGSGITFFEPGGEGSIVREAPEQ
jgi:hypothetical protein